MIVRTFGQKSRAPATVFVTAIALFIVSIGPSSGGPTGSVSQIPTAEPLAFKAWVPAGVAIERASGDRNGPLTNFDLQAGDLIDCTDSTVPGRSYLKGVAPSGVECTLIIEKGSKVLVGSTSEGSITYQHVTIQQGLATFSGRGPTVAGGSGSGRKFITKAKTFALGVAGTVYSVEVPTTGAGKLTVMEGFVDVTKDVSPYSPTRTILSDRVCELNETKTLTQLTETSVF